MKKEIIISIKDEKELQYLQYTLLETIFILSSLEEEKLDLDSIHWLSKILLLTYQQY